MTAISDNNKHKDGKSKNLIIILLAIVAVSAVVVAVWAVISMNSADSKASDDPTFAVREVVRSDGTKETVAVLTDTIDLPQFAWLDLKADTKAQELTFSNPPQNFADIRVSILLADRTVLWTSKKLSPGETSEKVVLSKALPKGEYEKSILKYECFRSDDEQSPLNGAENILTLKVK